MLYPRSFSVIDSGISFIVISVFLAGRIAVVLSGWRKNTVWYEEDYVLGREEEINGCVFTNLPPKISPLDVSSYLSLEYIKAPLSVVSENL